MSDFIVFPAIDLKGGQVVRLAEGDMARATVYGDDPAAQATLFADQGAQHLHVVDLDGAFAGESRQRRGGAGDRRALPRPRPARRRDPNASRGGGVVRPRRLAGGDRHRRSGEPAVRPRHGRGLPWRHRRRGRRRDGFVATKGWAEVSDVEVIDLARRFEDAGVAALLFTDVGRDGLLKGCNVQATVDLARAVDMPVIASGGVAGIAEIHVLALHARDGVEGVITGRALYDGRLDLAAALSVAAAA